MSSPATRLLAVLELLQGHGRISGPELARRLQVDVRTLRRYIVRLEDMGIPITTERGRHGAYMLVAGFKLPPMMFTDDEALALSVGLLATRRLGLGGAAPALESAQAKLDRVLPSRLRQRMRAVEDTVSIDLAQAVPAPGDHAALMTLTAAAQAGRGVHLAYRSERSERTQRDFDPYGLAWRGGAWYAVGLCHLRQSLRSFRLDRMLRVEPRDRAFQRPADFDALEHLALGIATLPRSLSVEVLLRADLEQAQSQLSAAIGLFVPQAQGVLLRSRTDHPDWFARQLARLPFDFSVRKPQRLRRALAAHARRLLAVAGDPLDG